MANVIDATNVFQKKREENTFAKKYEKFCIMQGVHREIAEYIIHSNMVTVMLVSHLKKLEEEMNTLRQELAEDLK